MGGKGERKLSEKLEVEKKKNVKAYKTHLVENMKVEKILWRHGVSPACALSHFYAHLHTLIGGRQKR